MDVREVLPDANAQRGPRGDDLHVDGLEFDAVEFPIAGQGWLFGLVGVFEDDDYRPTYMGGRPFRFMQKTLLLMIVALLTAGCSGQGVSEDATPTTVLIPEGVERFDFMAPCGDVLIDAGRVNGTMLLEDVECGSEWGVFIEDRWMMACLRN
jgi:hypothetical protein